MANYLVRYNFRSDLKDLSNSDKALVKPEEARIGASSATRAISAVLNDLKAEGAISSRSEVIVAEAVVVA